MIIAIPLLEMKSYFHLVVKNLLILAHCNANFTLNSVKQMIIQSVMSMMINLLSFQFEYSSKKFLIKLFVIFLKSSFKQNMALKYQKLLTLEYRLTDS